MKRGKKYWLDIRIKGKRIRRSLYTSNKLEALDRFGKKREELLTEYGQKQVKFSTFCEQYLEWAWSSKPASAKREEQRLFKIREQFQNMNIIYLSDITPYHIEQLKAWLRSQKIRGGRMLSKRTINLYLQLLRGLFYKAIDWEVYNKPNPLKKVRFFRISYQIKPLSHAQVRKILKVAKDISQEPKSPLQRVFYDLCLIALNTGMRRAEILNLKWGDIQGEEIVIKGKGDKMRVIPLNEIAKSVISKQPRKMEYVFDIPNRHQTTAMVKTINRIKKLTEIDFYFHLFRHYFTTSLIENGVDFVTIGSLLGHSKLTTSLMYSHTNGEKKRRAMDTLLDTVRGD